MREYRWATLGCGVIANEFAEAMKKQGRSIYSVANRTYEKAEIFAEKYGISKVYKNINELFTDENVDIVYISTPHNTHIPYVLEALKNGKHVLCEKSITLNSEELAEAVELSKKNNLILAEAMTIYHMPLYRKLKEVINNRDLGYLQLIQMNFGSYKEYDMTNRFFSRDLAGGALLDIGIYAISFVRWFMSEKPTEILSQVKYTPTKVDEQATILLMNSKNEMSTISLTLHGKQPKRGTIVFEKGYIEIYEYPRSAKAIITYTESNEQEIIEAGKTEDALLYEVLDMEKTISESSNEMYLNYTIDVMDIMTKIRKSWGMKYPEEEILLQK